MKQLRSRAMIIIMVLLSTFFSNTLLSKISGTIECAIIDTIERESFLYRPFIEILESVGYRVTYKPLDLVIDQSPSQLALSRYKLVFFILGSEFLSGLARQSHFCQKVLQALDTYAKLSGVTIGLVFPSMRTDPHINLVSSCAQIFNRLGVQTPVGPLSFPKIFESTSANSNAFFYITNIFLTTPLESRPKLYQTTLNMPHPGIQLDTEELNTILGRSGQPLFLLPIKQDCSQEVKLTLPYGLYWFNQARRNHVFITTTTLLTFSGISENFNICPINFGLREEMLSLVQRMMFELKLLASSKDNKSILDTVSKIKKQEGPLLPEAIKKVNKTGKFHTQTRKTAWMEISIFEPLPVVTPEREQAQDNLIMYIFTSGLDALWISFNPHMYYSSIGRLSSAEKQKYFIKTISSFTNKLADGAKKYHAKVPTILVGYEITNNLYEPNMPKRYAVDLYENKYPDLPEPLDRNFWRDQIVTPLQVFVKAWQAKGVSNGIILDGVVLDLEMYCRKKSGSFLNPMGFEGHTFEKFAKNIKKPWEKISLRDRILLLMNHKLGHQYFSFLEHEAQQLGLYLKNSFNRVFPDGKIMCYLPNLQTSWFYKGLTKGLTDRKNPVHLLTFNSDFFSHEAWFIKNRIPVTHACVLLLSKLKTQADFDLVDLFLANHHGIWLNRFSRFAEPRAKDWTSIEQPGIPESEYPLFMDYLKSK